MKKDSLKQKEINWAIETLTMFNKRWYKLYKDQPDEKRNIILIDFGIVDDWLTIKVNNQAHLTNVIDFLRFMNSATSLNWRVIEEEQEIKFEIF